MAFFGISGKYLHFKTKLCLEIVTKTGQDAKRFWFNVNVDPLASLVGTDHNQDSDSSNVLRRTNPFLTNSDDVHPISVLVNNLDYSSN